MLIDLAADLVHLFPVETSEIRERSPLVLVVGHQHAPFIGLEQPDHVVEQHRLATPGRADNGEDVPAVDAERDALEHLVVVEGAVETLHLDLGRSVGVLVGPWHRRAGVYRDVSRRCPATPGARPG